MVLSALGFCVLDGRRSRPEAEILMRIGAFAYLTGSIVGVVAETLELAGAAVYPAIVAYVTLAFAGQDIIGGALVASALIPRWIGWATVLWNLAWLASLIIARPGGHLLPDTPSGDARGHRGRVAPTAHSWPAAHRDGTRPGPGQPILTFNAPGSRTGLARSPGNRRVSPGHSQTRYRRLDSTCATRLRLKR